NNFNTRFWQHYEENYKADVEKLGMTFDDIVTMASLIQMEARFIIDYECISYVFHNRLSHSNTFPYLESDATIQYFLDARKEDLSAEDLKTDNPYNSYLYAGLTPGAICCPGLDALEAAIYPAPPVDANGREINAYYFVSDVTGKTYYAQYNSGHEANKKKAEEVNKLYDEQE
ncbi:MAG: endolytic transglycosylase MltG, partial [Clostridia bacterium]|nr:endolytic transglycosylase MltG [Clostridia bacterium]